jgi:hypothetical protein
LIMRLCRQSQIFQQKISSNGKFTTKNIFRHLQRQEAIQLPQQGSRSLTQQANFILQKV